MTLVALWIVALVALVAIFTLPLVVAPLRRAMVSRPLLLRFRQVMPRMSQTERDALEAGTVSWDGELFSGAPSWPKLFSIETPKLTADEQRFLDNEVETLCAMVSDWETTNVYRDLPAEAWRYIREHGFLGMIIPKAYGGLGFSAYAHSQVVTKLSTRCASAAVTVLVPNSLGPGELLLQYGTDAQKRHYLPRLACGIDIPCFALTNPTAGSDAASIPDFGIVCEGEHEGRRVLGLRVTWDKRYITLGPVATLLGLAFRAYDPDRLLGEHEDLGITCALIPTSHPGVEIGRRHMPLNAVFQNGPTSGRDVFIPLDWVIGGAPMIGKGWRMLMECLAAGRGISLPSSNTGMAKLAVRATGAYARVRTQFKLPIGRFEGVEEALARMGGNLYAMDATRVLTAALVDEGEKPSVLSGIAKLHITERARQVVNDAMDIAGGKGICMGPSNVLGAAYMQMPVSITVEGANILTRSLIVFGQGAIRCHPYVLREMAATQERHRGKALHDFDQALYGHLRFAARNFARTLALGATGSHFARVPGDIAPAMRRYYQQMTRLSSSLALTADVAMATLGGALKRKEKISARLGDVLSQLYVCSAVLWRYEREGRQDDDAPFVHFAVRDAMFKAQAALEGVIENFPHPLLAALMRRIVFPLGRPFVVPGDALGHDVAKRLIEPGAARERLTHGMFIGPSDEPVGLLERALEATIAAEPIERRIEDARRRGTFDARLAPGEGAAELAERAHAAGIVTAEERDLLATQRELAARVIRVDDFDRDLGASLLRPVDGARESAPRNATRCEDALAPPSSAEAANDDIAPSPLTVHP
ncbi:MAG TPA: acyl-CoA dehydrogenase [Casimicrobiaceae bacterium]|nr:acyl-CoA dehydrogenase [Casimicrobiaceae bacterium]